MQGYPRQPARPRAKSRRLTGTCLSKKIATLRCATGAHAESLPCAVAEGAGEDAEVVANPRRQRQELRVRGMLRLPQRQNRDQANPRKLRSKTRILGARKPGRLKSGPSKP